MKSLALVFLFMLMIVAAMAQSSSFKRIDTIDCRPLVAVNGKLVDPLSFLAIDRQDIRDFKFLTPAAAITKFGNGRSQFGAVEITLIKTAKIFTLKELAKRFYLIPAKMPTEARLYYYGYFVSLPIGDPALFITSASMAQRISVNLNDYQINRPIITVGILNIKDYKNNPKTLTKPFDKDMEQVKTIFDAESDKRIKNRK
jgi:hypothetical protein